MKGKGFVILLIGKRNTGKTTKTKQLLIKYNKPQFIFDFRKEYGKHFLPFKTFVSEAVKLENHNIVIEEATVFISKRNNDENIKNLLAGASHQKNNLYILYHSLRSIPDFVFEMSDYYYLFKTGDNEGVVRTLYRYEPEVIEDFTLVSKKTDEHFYTVRKRA